MLTPDYTTCDLYDSFADKLATCTTQLRSFGRKVRAEGPAVLVRCAADNSQVKRLLGEAGKGRMLIVDGSSRLSHALLGDLIAASAVANGWAGVIVFAAVRDTTALADIDLHIKALGNVPRKSQRCDQGIELASMECGGIWWHKDDWVYSDQEGILVSRTKL